MTKSPHYNDRKGDIRFIILHYTETDSLQETLDIMDERQVSAHYVIDEDGAVYNIVDESKRAWHAGKSFWQGISDINSHSVGIELQNDGTAEFAKPQLESLVKLLGEIMARHNIKPSGILAHSDIAPARKSDPGEKFPWAWLAGQGYGFFPEKQQASAEDLPAYLEQIGYGDCDIADSITAFQRRYRPAKINGQADDECAGLAKCILGNLQ